MNRRGEYEVSYGLFQGRGGNGPRLLGASRVGAATPVAASRYVPVIDVDVESPQQAVALTSRAAIWDPEVEQIAGSGPSYYTERDGGWWYFVHPQGEVWLEGRRYRPIRPRARVTVLEAGTRVGQGSLFGHTPGEVEDELDQLHGELTAFGQEVIELARRSEGQVIDEIRKVHDEELAAWKTVDSFQALVNERDRLQKLGPSHMVELAAAQVALERFMPAARRAEAIARARELTSQRSALEARRLQEFPLMQWMRSTWTPFFESWRSFRESKKDIPLQTLPGSGVWDRVQEYRKQFIDLRKNAPFKSTSPEPLDPSTRKDPSFTGIFGSVGNILKWTAIGVLTFGGIFAVSSLATTLKKGHEPLEYYTGRRRR